MLLAAGTDVHARDESERTALEYIVAHAGPGDLSRAAPTARMLVGAGAEVTDAVRESVQELGAAFLRIRDAYDPDSVDEAGRCLADLESLTGTALPVRQHDGVSPIEVHAAD